MEVRKAQSWVRVARATVLEATKQKPAGAVDMVDATPSYVERNVYARADGLVGSMGVMGREGKVLGRERRVEEREALASGPHTSSIASGPADRVQVRDSSHRYAYRKIGRLTSWLQQEEQEEKLRPLKRPWRQ